MKITIVDGHGWSFFNFVVSFIGGLLVVLIVNWVK